MKKTILTLLFMAVAVSASAKFRWGPTASATFDTYHWKQSLVGNEMRPGFTVGLMGELMIPGIGFGIDFGLRYANRGARIDLSDQYIWSSENTGNPNYRLHTLQIPVDLRFKYTRLNGVENYVAPFILAGPVFNIDVAHSDLKAMESSGGSVGVRVALGAELYKKFQIDGGYNWDLTYDIRTRKLDNFSARLQGWFVDFTVLF